MNHHYYLLYAWISYIYTYFIYNQISISDINIHMCVYNDDAMDNIKLIEFILFHSIQTAQWKNNMAQLSRWHHLHPTKCMLAIVTKDAFDMAYLIYTLNMKVCTVFFSYMCFICQRDYVYTFVSLFSIIIIHISMYYYIVYVFLISTWSDNRSQNH